eukprot:CAMPEP_0113549456 /NCGR_PEP_ID=MMETSP0015_2-20120614/13442_1 /TAXON_ID=2838 /ORGANISM="Odontella" /LENGTH=377 /DNA_ID=CAMNT_0000450165 /DNA_START=496 /DNA_END=1629 /DNA_ORIENTATION=- /assembly_acc=CAM_ASM_000160
MAPLIIPRIVTSIIFCGFAAAKTHTSSYYSDNYPRRPVVGVLTEPNSRRTEHYIAASYVKWLEAAGARSVAIPWEATDAHVEDIFKQVNGILLPGGSDSRLPRAAKKIWELAKEANDNDDFFPLWATCLGFEYLIQIVGDEDEETLQTGFDSWNISMTVNFTDEVQDSRLFANKEIRDIMTSHPVAMNNHHHGIEPKKFASDSSLSSTFLFTATNIDRKGRPFVGAIEARHYPFYGVQFHPEKNSFEFATFPGTDTPYEAINHSAEAVRVCLYMAEFFVSKARRNTHVYKDVKQFPLVWNYKMVLGLSFEQKFVIDKISKERPLLLAEASGTHWASNETKWAHALLSIFAVIILAGFIFIHLRIKEKKSPSDGNGEK